MAIASLPMWRMSWRRRFAYSSLRMDPRAFELVEGELRARAHELVQLLEIAFCGLASLPGLEPGARDLGKVAQEFADVAVPRGRRIRRARADAVEKPLAPGRQRRNALGERRVVGRQQRDEGELLRSEGGQRLSRQPGQRPVGRRSRNARIGGELGEPFLRVIAL